MLSTNSMKAAVSTDINQTQNPTRTAENQANNNDNGTNVNNNAQNQSDNSVSQTLQSENGNPETGQVLFSDVANITNDIQRYSLDSRFETQDVLNRIAYSENIYLVALKAAFAQSNNGYNGDEIVVNRSYSVGLRGMYFWRVPSSLLKFGGIADFSLTRRARAGNEYDVWHEDNTFLDYLDLSVMFGGYIHGITFGIGGGCSFLAKNIELPSHMKNIEPFMLVSLGYMYEIIPNLKVFLSFDVRIALYTMGLKSARTYPTFELTVKEKRVVSFLFNIGVGF